MQRVDDDHAPSAITAADTIPSLLEWRAHETPDNPAVGALGRPPLTYAELNRRVKALASDLSARNVGRGDGVAVVLPNGPEMAVLFLAASSVAAAAPLNPSYQAGEFEFYLQDLGARVLLIDAGMDSPAREIARKLGVAVVDVAAERGAAAGIVTLSGSGGARDRGAAGVRARGEDVALLLHTSGTTSRPKQVPLAHANLLASAAHIAGTLGLSERDHCLNVMPLFHIHGLIAAALASLYAGGSVVCTPGFNAPDFFDWLEAARPTWYTAVPTMHQAILARAAAHADAIRQSRLRFVRSSSSALPRTTMEELERVFGVPVVEAYGMTEASHQIASNPLPPAPRKPGSVGMAAGPAIAVMGEAGELLTAGETGEVVIRGRNVTRGYANNAAANDAAFRGDWFRTGDQGHVDEDGYLFLTGRLKEMINRGGEKVAPLEVDEALMAHPAVQQALAFAVRHPQLGEDVAAAVVLGGGEQVTERELREFVAGRLAYFKVPRRVLFLPDIPKGPTGKLQRIGLAERLGIPEFDAVRVEVPYVEPRSPVEEVVAAVWSQVLRSPPPGVHDNFFAAGGDSVTAMQLVARIRDVLRVELPLLSFFDAPTVAGVAEEVERMLAPDVTSISSN